MKKDGKRRRDRPITDSVEIVEVVAAWVVEAEAEGDQPPLMSFVVLARCADGSGSVMHGSGDDEEDADFYTVPREYMGEVVERDLAAQAEKVLRTVSELGRKVALRHVEIRSGDPVVVREKVRAAGLRAELIPGGHA